MDYSRLNTEKINPRTVRLDTFPISRIIGAMSKEDQAAVAAVRRARVSIAYAAGLIEKSLRANGRLFFVGAGTSGRLGVMEAAECPPTFQTSPRQIQAVTAGGRAAVFQSREGAEDNGAKGRAEMRRRTRAGDAVVGIAASGVTPFVLEALKTARRKNCVLILLTCNPAWRTQARGFKPDAAVILNTGPEVIAGSTRLKAGSATKMALNMLTTAALVRLGKTYGNRMVDLQMKSKKLRERAIRIVGEIAGVERARALEALERAHGKAKPAIVMLKKNLSYAQAVKVLSEHQGFLRKALQ